MDNTPENNELPAMREPPAEGGSPSEVPAKVPDRKIIERLIQVQSQDIGIRRQELAQDLEIRRQEIALKKEELELRKQESAQGYDFAKKSLDAQSEDLKKVRTQEGTVYCTT